MFTPELLKRAKEQVKKHQIRPMKIAGRDHYLALVHPDWIKSMQLTSREAYEIDSRCRRLAARLERENEGFTEKLKMFGDDIRMIGLQA